MCHIKCLENADCLKILNRTSNKNQNFANIYFLYVYLLHCEKVHLFEDVKHRHAGSGLILRQTHHWSLFCWTF